jgi:hypothetical protein
MPLMPITHVVLHWARDWHLLVKDYRDPPGAIVGMGRIDLINAMLGGNFLS